MWYAEWVGWQDMRASFPLLNSPQPTCTLLLTPHCSFDTMNLVKIMLKLTWHNHPPDRFWQSCWYYFDRVSLVQSWYIQRGSFLPLARNYLAWAICKSLRIFSLSIFWNIILKYFFFWMLSDEASLNFMHRMKEVSPLNTHVFLLNCSLWSSSTSIKGGVQWNIQCAVQWGDRLWPHSMGDETVLPMHCVISREYTALQCREVNGLQDD